MHNHQTQQFAKFFIKDLKSKKSKYENNKPINEEIEFTTSN